MLYKLKQIKLLHYIESCDIKIVRNRHNQICVYYLAVHIYRDSIKNAIL